MSENYQLLAPRTDRAAVFAELKRALQTPPVAVPEASLELLYDAARIGSGGGQVARSFLFWLAGQPDSTGFVGDGGLELRRLDGNLKAAAMEVLAWWAGPTRSDRPLYEVLHKLRVQFAPEEEQDNLA